MPQTSSSWKTTRLHSGVTETECSGLFTKRSVMVWSNHEQISDTQGFVRPAATKRYEGRWFVTVFFSLSHQWIWLTALLMNHYGLPSLILHDERRLIVSNSWTLVERICRDVFELLSCSSGTCLWFVYMKYFQSINVVVFVVSVIAESSHWSYKGEGGRHSNRPLWMWQWATLNGLNTNGPSLLRWPLTAFVTRVSQRSAEQPLRHLSRYRDCSPVCRRVTREVSSSPTIISCLEFTALDCSRRRKRWIYSIFVFSLCVKLVSHLFRQNVSFHRGSGTFYLNVKGQHSPVTLLWNVVMVQMNPEMMINRRNSVPAVIRGKGEFSFPARVSLNDL